MSVCYTDKTIDEVREICRQSNYNEIESCGLGFKCKTPDYIQVIEPSYDYSYGVVPVWGGGRWSGGGRRWSGGRGGGGRR